MGIESKIEPHLAIGIGGLTYGVSPLEMASAYGTLATYGEHTKPIAVTKVVDWNGRVILENKPKLQRVLDKKIAGQTTQILSDVVKRGTGIRADIAGPRRERPERPRITKTRGMPIYARHGHGRLDGPSGSPDIDALGSRSTGLRRVFPVKCGASI